jgi:hypothetical protein
MGIERRIVITALRLHILDVIDQADDNHPAREAARVIDGDA